MRVVIYRDHRLQVEDDSMSFHEIQESISLIFPEITDCVPRVYENEIHFITQEQHIQLQLTEKLEAKGGRGNQVAHKDMGWLRGRFDAKAYAQKLKATMYVYQGVRIGGEYADKGGYAHLVGKTGQVIQENEELDICIIKADDDGKEYVIRKKDIQYI